MTDINKIRDEICDNPEFNIGDTKMDALLLNNRKWGFDQAITHLSKQSVAFDEKELLKICSFDCRVPRHLGELLEKQYVTIAEWQHYKTSLIYEAKLAVAVEALKFYADKSLGNGAYVFRKKFTFDLINEADLEVLCEPIGAKGEKYVVGGKLAREALKDVGVEV
jgi:hypothetical protein